MKTVFVSGSFNVLHPGHLRLLRFARECGDKLIVGVLSDRVAGPAAHVQEQHRLDGVKSIALVDEVFLVDEPIESVISRMRPTVVVKGKEHELLFNPEVSPLSAYGGALIFGSGESTFSSLDLIQKEFSATEMSAISLPFEYLSRHHIDRPRLTDLLHRFTQLKICVVGDLVIDEYITCEPLGMSQEDASIVVTPVHHARFVGGAGIVASHAAGLGASVRFFSVTGDDPVRKFAITELAAAGVDAELIVDENRPTTLKQRYRCKGKSVMRVSHLHQGAIPSKLQSQLIDSLKAALRDSDLLVFSDFNYGCLPQGVVEAITPLAREKGILLAADSQSSSQVGDVSRFKGMDLLTPTEREARISTRNREDGLVVLAEQLRVQANAMNVLLKLGEEGLLIHADNPHSGSDKWLTDRIQALNSAPKDVAGAGDSLLITSAMALACKATIWEAALLGSLAAAIQVGRLGNTPLRTEELVSELL